MLDFMETVQNAFYEASHWNVDNSYGTLNATARGTSTCHIGPI
jgi:distribution and morphology protein 10